MAVPPVIKFSCNAALLALKTVLVAASFFIFAAYQVIRISFVLASKVTRAAVQALFPYVIIGGILLCGYRVFSYFRPPDEPSPPPGPRRRVMAADAERPRERRVRQLQAGPPESAAAAAAAAERPLERREPPRAYSAPELLEMIRGATDEQQTAITELFQDILPTLYFCCINQTLMIDPVRDPTTTGDHAHTYYERAAILQWLTREETSPVTRASLHAGNLQPPDPDLIARRNQALIDHQKELLRIFRERR